MSVNTIETEETIRFLDRCMKTMLNDLNRISDIHIRLLKNEAEASYADMVDAKVLDGLLSKFSYYLDGTSIGE
jgi:hypothetical protein